MSRTVSSPTNRVIPGDKSGTGAKAAKLVKTAKSNRSTGGAAKKTDTPAAPAEMGARAPGKRFAKDDLLALENGQLRVENAEQAAMLQRHAVDDFARKAQEALKAERDKFDGAVKAYEAAKIDLAKTYASLEERYGISMKEITYDQKTGAIRSIPKQIDAAAAKSAAAGGAVVAVPTV